MKIYRTKDMVPVPKNSLSKTKRAFNNEIFELLSWYKIIWMVYSKTGWINKASWQKLFI